MEDPEVLIHKMRELGAEFAKAKAHRIYLEEWRKSKLAILARKAAADGATTIAAQDRAALADQEYADVLLAIKIAVEAEERLRYRLASIEMELEIWRTKRADERAERKAYGA